jgi:VCBS repeat-containing protein
MIAAMDTAVLDAGLALNLNPIDRGNGVVELDGDDEDGVTGPAGGPIGFFNAFVKTELEVTASAFGLLDAWVDFNRDGDWDDATEQIFANQQLQEGVNTLFVSTPLAPVSKAGDTYARFRFSSNGGLTATGLAADGEVEDYLIQIVDGSPPQATDDPTTATTSLYTVTEDDLLNGPSVLDNDSDADGDPFRVLDFDNPSLRGADVNVNLDFNNVAGAGIFTYDPRNAEQLQALSVGEVVGDSFTYGLIESSAHDFESQTPGTVTITVTGLNDIPEAGDLPIAASEDGDTVSESFVGDDADNDNDITNLVYAIKNVELALPATGAAGLTDGESFTVTQGANPPVIFELNNTDVDPAFTGDVSIDFTDSSTLDEIADTIVLALDGAGLGLVPVNLGSGVVDLGRSAGHTLDASAAPSLTARGLPLGSGAVTNNGDGTFTFDPKANVDFQQLNQDEDLDITFTYTATDLHLAESTEATVTITVTGVNDEPVAVNDAYTIDQDQLLDADDQDGTLTPSNDNDNGVLVNDSDPDAGDFPVVTELNSDSGNMNTDVETALGATINMQPDGTFSYDPTASDDLRALAAGETAVDLFTYSIKDSQDVIATATVTITVSGVNDNPVANDDGAAGDIGFNSTLIYEIDQFNVLTVNAGLTPPDLLQNDSDPDTTDTIEVTVQNAALTSLGGLVTVRADGSFDYDPTGSAVLNDLVRVDLADPGNGVFHELEDTFDYEMHDAILTSTATATIRVFGVNKDPVANDDAYATSEDDPLSIPPVDGLIQGGLGGGADTDPEVDILTVTGIQGTGSRSGRSDQGAQVTVDTDGGFTYDPNSNATDENGVPFNLAIQALNDLDTLDDKFTYTITDGVPGSTPATAEVTISLTGVNDIPVAVDDSDTTPRNSDVDIPVTNNDSDVDGTLLASSVEVTVDPSAGTAMANGDNTITFTPPTDTSGIFTFKYRVRDDSLAFSEEATVTVLVNDPPVANDDTVTAILDVQNTASVFDIVANDFDTEGGLDPSTITIVSGPDSSLGEIEEIREDGTIVYRPKTTVSTPAVDTITYTVSDADGAVSEPGTVTINIVDDPSPWQNGLNPLDVNGDTFVSPIDALLIITYLNDNGPGPLPVPTAGFLPPPFLDPTGDDECNATDVIEIINFLNANASGEGEGESPDSDWQLNATSQLDVGVALPVLGDRFAGFSAPLTTVDRASQQQSDSVAAELPETVTDNNQYPSATVVSSNLRATGLKIADSESLEDLLETIADDLADVGETSVRDLAIEQWTSRYLDN